jgi:hypothetical protein
MFAKCLQFRRSILWCGLVLGGISLAGPVPVRANNPVQQLEKKLDKARKKSRRALRKAREAGQAVLEGAAQIGSAVAVGLMQAEFDFDCTGDTRNNHSQRSGRNSSTHSSATHAAVPSAPPAAAAHGANNSHSGSSEDKFYSPAR